MPNLYDVGAVGAGFVPGSGILDMLGQAPAIGGGMGPSFVENLKRKQYMDALMQMVGAAGDAAMIVPPVGLGIKGVATAGKTARAAGKATKAAKTIEAPAVITKKASNYLVDTPTNPNPLVGTRYKTAQVPNTQAARREGNLDDLLGSSLITYPTDMLSRNVRINEVSKGQKLGYSKHIEQEKKCLAINTQSIRHGILLSPLCIHLRHTASKNKD